MKYLGTSGWYYQHWVKRFYPKDLSKDKWLEYYARHFNTVEINSTFYHLPYKNVLKNWYNQTPEKFRFTLKANRQITHVKKFKNVKKSVKTFYMLSDIMQEKLANILWQIPPTLKFNMKKLNEIIKVLNPDYKNVIEFRHKSWFTLEVYENLKENDIIYCIVSGPNLPLDFKLTAKTGYFRLHGRSWYNYNYGKKELTEFAGKIKKLKAKDFYIYFNNDYNAYAIKNCEMLKGLI
ncbi:DUF72 domain-containing protein [Candidatus Woesearchaeota archaeon]|nr:MAG: DUF72 domain-containing protein [Candidatus Woesearchaeota archaeon]